MRRPWNVRSELRPWQEQKQKPQFGTTRHEDKRYHSPRWRNLRRQYLQFKPLCVMCEAKGIIRPAEVLDHINPVVHGGAFWDESNLQGLCNHCHRVKTNKEIAKRNLNKKNNG